MRILIVLLLVVAIANNCKAQKHVDTVHRYNNALYLELGGPGLLYSLGYERTWYQNRHFAVMSSAGYSYIPSAITITYLESDVLFRDGNAGLELGLAYVSYVERPSNGSSFGTANGSYTATQLAPRLGARMFSKNQRFHYRLGITPMILLQNNESKVNKNDRFFFWANVFTIGYRF